MLYIYSIATHTTKRKAEEYEIREERFVRFAIKIFQESQP